MKEIKAFIRPHKLSAVTIALHEVLGIHSVSVTDCRGLVHASWKVEHHRDLAELEDYYPHIKIEILCGDEAVDRLVSAIQENSHTGVKGDGIIYVSDVEKVTRISTGTT